MSRFTERLWGELVREHGGDLARTSRPAPRGRLTRPRLLAGTTAGVAAAGTALALIFGAASSSPAFAVTPNHDGTVSVVIRQFGAIHGVNARLAKLGLHAQFVQAGPGCAAPPPMIHAARLARADVTVHVTSVTPGVLKARIDPRHIPVGRMLVVSAWREGGAIKAGTARVMRGAGPPCFKVAGGMNSSRAARVGDGGSIACVIVRTQVRPATGNSGDALAGNIGPPPSGKGDVPPVANSGTPAPSASESALPGAPSTTVGPPPGSCPASARVLKDHGLAREKGTSTAPR